MPKQKIKVPGSGKAPAADKLSMTKAELEKRLADARAEGAKTVKVESVKPPAPTQEDPARPEVIEKPAAEKKSAEAGASSPAQTLDDRSAEAIAAKAIAPESKEPVPGQPAEDKRPMFDRQDLKYFLSWLTDRAATVLGDHWKLSEEETALYSKVIDRQDQFGLLANMKPATAFWIVTGIIFVPRSAWTIRNLIIKARSGPGTEPEKPGVKDAGPVKRTLTDGPGVDVSTAIRGRDGNTGLVEK
jgi:hypothetical protein